MSEWIPVAEKLIDLGEYYITAMIVKEVLINCCISVSIITVGYFAYKLGRKAIEVG